MTNTSLEESRPLLRPHGDKKAPRCAYRRAWLPLLVLALVGGTVFLNLGGKVDLAAEITPKRLSAHLEAFAKIAHANNGSRSVAGGSGYLASVDFIYNTLKTNTDYVVSKQRFTFPLFMKNKPGYLRFSTESLAAFFSEELVSGHDFEPLNKSGNGTVKSARVQAVPGGCNSADFASFEKGSVALISREAPALTPDEPCIYRAKISNALNAGASAVLLYTNLPTAGPVLGSNPPDAKDFPVFGITHAVALYVLQKLAIGTEKVTVSLESNVKYVDFETYNVIADTKSGNDNSIIVAGSHLDSVPAGPGINDDASGSSATLEVALALYRTGLSKNVKNKVRFAWWSAEELGLVGSTWYVDNLAKTNPEELKKIALNLNNDMIASPNGARFIYNGREAVNPDLRGPSGRIQSIFEDYFDSKGLAHETTPFDGRSDYGEFLKFGIPAGGLFTGAEQIKTEAQWKKFGGTPGIPYDPCYHLACDTLENIQGLGMELFSDLASSMGHIVQKLASLDDLRGYLSE
ncbi:hypothetical protein HDU77_002595 [Chytriomyces hyalinus]|nr:hypothetical protein HDU77_002595 [Chytriomyces hyalinus]